MAKRYLIPIEEIENGKRNLLWAEAIKNLQLDKRESMMIYFTPDQPIATLYIFENLGEIAAWMASDKGNKIGISHVETSESSENGSDGSSDSSTVEKDTSPTTDDLKSE